MNEVKVNLLGIFLTLIVSIGSSLATTSYFTGRHVQQILSNTDRIIVLERQVGELAAVMQIVKEDAAVNRTNIEWIKDYLTREGHGKKR